MPRLKSPLSTRRFGDVSPKDPQLPLFAAWAVWLKFHGVACRVSTFCGVNPSVGVSAGVLIRGPVVRCGHFDVCLNAAFPRDSFPFCRLRQ